MPDSAKPKRPRRQGGGAGPADQASRDARRMIEMPEPPLVAPSMRPFGPTPEAVETGAPVKGGHPAGRPTKRPPR